MDGTGRAFGGLLATATVLLAAILGGCGGGAGAGDGSTSAAAPGAAPATAHAVAPTGYLQGYSLIRVGWYTYDAAHTTTPLIANVQTTLSDSGAVAGYTTIEACADCAYMEATNGTPTYSAVDDYCMGHDGRMACPSQDTAINVTGTTAGVELMGFPAYNPYSAAPALHAFVGGADMGTLGGDSSYATGINAAGQVVGYSDLAGNVDTQAFLYSRGIMSALQVPGSRQGRATAINGKGQVAGFAIPADSTLAHAFFYSQGNFTDLGEGMANALNAGGQVAGTNIAGAFLSGRDGGALQALGAGSAVGVNAAGQVVINGAGAFIWDGAAQVDLNAIIAPGDPLAGRVALTNVVAINDRGQILVNGHDQAGWKLQFLLSPPPVLDQLARLQHIVNPDGSGTTIGALVAQAQAEQAAGNQAGTCQALSAVAAGIAAAAGREMPAGTASRLAVDVRVIMSAADCAV